MGSKVGTFCIFLFGMLLLERNGGQQWTYGEPYNHFLSIEIPAHGNTTKYMEKWYVYHITRAEFNIARPIQGFAWARVIFFNAYWIDVCLDCPPDWKYDTQICYLTSEPGMIAQNLDLHFIRGNWGKNEGGSALTFRVEGENWSNETFPVVLTGYVERYHQSRHPLGLQDMYDPDEGFVQEVIIANRASNRCDIIYLVVLLNLAFSLVCVLF